MLGRKEAAMQPLGGEALQPLRGGETGGRAGEGGKNRKGEAGVERSCAAARRLRSAAASEGDVGRGGRKEGQKLEWNVATLQPEVRKALQPLQQGDRRGRGQGNPLRLRNPGIQFCALPQPCCPHNLTPRTCTTLPPRGRSAAPDASAIHGCSSACSALSRLLGSRSSTALRKSTQGRDSWRSSCGERVGERRSKASTVEKWALSRDSWRSCREKGLGERRSIASKLRASTQGRGSWRSSWFRVGR